MLAHAQSSAPALWPTIPFIRGADLCQYQDAYSRSRSSLMREMSAQVKDLVFLGATAEEALVPLVVIDGLITKNRALAAGGPGWDITLEAAVKSALDQMVREASPRVRKIGFYNPASLVELLSNLREQRQRGALDSRMLGRVSGVAWGTYTFASGCKGDIFLTVHVELRSGETFSFSGSGLPETAAYMVASRMFTAFQATRFPSEALLGSKKITLVGTPGGPVTHTPTPADGERACASMSARLPSAEEYEQLSLLGDWSGGVSLKHDIWVLAGGKVLAPDLRNPSPIRSADEVRGQELHFYCVR
ncbi:MAG: hypothetical protein ACKOXU_12085 [Limnohabitans sp.]